MSMQTTAAVARSAEEDFELEDVMLEDLRPDEALVQIHACGVCGMDVEAKATAELPSVLGHEGAGIVLESGPEVDNVQPGDRVVLGYGFCGSCPQCENCRPYFCDESWRLAFAGVRLDGSNTARDSAGNPIAAAFFQQSSFARHAITPARGLVRISGKVPWSVAAALPCGFLTGVGAAQNVLAVDARSTLLIRGVGAVGMGAVIGAKLAGCSRIAATDVRENRLELARKFGAAWTVNAATVDFKAWLASEMPRGFTHALDTTGNGSVFENTIECLAAGGQMAYAILPAPMEEFSFKPFQHFVKSATLKAVSFGSAVPAELLPRMLDWWSRGKFPIEAAIETYDFQDINAAVEAGASGRVVKPVLLMQ